MITTTGLEELVQCWDLEHQSFFLVPASIVGHVYNPEKPLIRKNNKYESCRILFPLSSDHLITLQQINVLRALVVNRTLISGILASPLDCHDEVIHVVPYPPCASLLPPTLLPTALQQKVPHGDWIDWFPSSEGRDCLIRALGTFDEDDLWADCIGGLFEGFPDDEVGRRGIIAWSPPWDVAGWEMSEGFLRKWGWLFAHACPDFLSATNRWRRDRGEEPLYL